ncbi:MAG: YqhA family protein [Cyanobacteriota bacterium]|nr:YqhA family protein [Cyanobacteriota bacterium]
MQKNLTFFSQIIILLAVTFTLLTALAAALYASLETLRLLGELFAHHWKIDNVGFHFIEVIELFLSAIALLILGTGLYELFIQPLNLPRPLRVESFHELKSHLGNIILLNMVVLFFGDLAEQKEAPVLLQEALAIGIISGILLLFTHLKEAHPVNQ